MSIFYCNNATGDDANDGTTWALAWRTATLGATAARLTAGDEIRFAKTPDPTLVGDADWTDLSKIVTLETAVNAIIDMCTAVWTGGTAAVTSATNAALRKEGSTAVDIVIGAAFDTGKVAYKTIAETDYSGYQQISFWMRTTLATTALQICLCSDTLGATPVDTLTIPALSTINTWYPITINKGAALGASIKSVAIYALVDPGTVTLTIDNIIACKAVGSADSLTLKSLISKNSLATGGTDSWHCIQSINGTTVMLDNGTQTLASAGQGYSGVTEHIATYKRETVLLAAIETVTKTGTNAAPISYKYGYNPATNIQDGETFLDGVCGTLGGFSLSSSKNFINISNLSIVRGLVGFSISSCTDCDIILGTLTGNTSFGFSNTTALYNSITIRDACNNVGININSTGYINQMTIINANSSITHGISLTGNAHRIICTNAKNNGGWGVYFSACSQNRVQVATTGNVLGGVFNDSGINYLNKSPIAEVTEFSTPTTGTTAAIYSTLHDNTVGNNKVIVDGGIINSQSAVKQTATGFAWKLSPTLVTRTAHNPLILPVARVAVDAGGATSVVVGFLRDSVDIIGKLVCRGGQLSGLTSDVIDTISVGINTWEDLVVTFTPSESGVVEIEAWVYGGTVNSVYVDNVRIS
jgi:hypothetical protein